MASMAVAFEVHCYYLVEHGYIWRKRETRPSSLPCPPPQPSPPPPPRHALGVVTAKHFAAEILQPKDHACTHAHSRWAPRLVFEDDRFSGARGIAMLRSADFHGVRTQPPLQR